MHDTISIIYVIMGHNFGNKYLPNQLVPESNKNPEGHLLASW